MAEPPWWTRQTVHPAWSSWGHEADSRYFKWRKYSPSGLYLVVGRLRKQTRGSETSWSLVIAEVTTTCHHLEMQRERCRESWNLKKDNDAGRKANQSCWGGKTERSGCSGFSLSHLPVSRQLVPLAKLPGNTRRVARETSSLGNKREQNHGITGLWAKLNDPHIHLSPWSLQSEQTPVSSEYCLEVHSTDL